MRATPLLPVGRQTRALAAATMPVQVTRPPAPDQDSSVPAPVLLAGDDGVPLRVREELSGAGVPTVSLCSSLDGVAARSALAAGARVVVGDPTDAAAWTQAGLEHAQAVGLL